MGQAGLMEIDIELLDIMDYNPNKMSRSVKEHLRKTIKERGFLQPIVVCPSGERFKVIDGAHRVGIYKDEKIPKISAYVVEERSDLDIKIDMVNLKNTAGEFDKWKYQELLKSINKDIEKEQMREIMNLEANDLKLMDELMSSEELEDLSENKISFIVKDIKCPECGHKGPKSEFKIQ